MSNDDSKDGVNLSEFAQANGTVEDTQRLFAEDAQQILFGSFYERSGIRGVKHDVSLYEAEEIPSVLDAIEVRAKEVVNSGLLVGAFSTPKEQEKFKEFCQDVVDAMPLIRQRFLTSDLEFLRSGFIGRSDRIVEGASEILKAAYTHGINVIERNAVLYDEPSKFLNEVATQAEAGLKHGVPADDEEHLKTDREEYKFFCQEVMDRMDAIRRNVANSEFKKSHIPDINDIA